jgi:tetratricopeptide (TPR) repeat protein
MSRRRQTLFVAVLHLSMAYSASAQPPAAPTGQASAPGLRKLTGDDEKRAKDLDAQIDNALKADRWDEAVAKAEELLALRMKVQGPKHFDTVDTEWQLKTLRGVAPMPKDDRVAVLSAGSINQQAETFLAQGKYAQAQPLFEQALAIRRRLLTDDHPYTATSYNNLAVSLNAQGKLTSAQSYFEKPLRIQRRLLTDNHPATAGSYNNLGANLEAQGKYAQAQPLYEKALAIYRGVFGDDHPTTAKAYNNVAANLAAQGKYAAAQPLFEKGLEIRRRLLTEIHTDVADSYLNVAHSLRGQGKYAAAQPLTEKALAIYRRLLTDDHPRTAIAYNNLAADLEAQGKYTLAEPLFVKALEIRRHLLTDNHPDTARSYNNLAQNLAAQGKFVQAQPVYEKALDIARRSLTDDHPTTAQCWNNLAISLNDQGQYAQAQPLFEKALEIRRRLLADDHPDTAQSYKSVADNLNLQEKCAQAQPLYEKALEIYRRLFTDEHPATAASYRSLAINLRAQGKYGEAQPLYEKALEIDRRLLTELHPETARAYGDIAVNLGSQGKYTEAQPLYEKALAIKRRLLTDEHSDTAVSYNSLAVNLFAQGKYAEAQPLFEKSLNLMRLRLTDDHPFTAIAHANLGSNLNALGKYGEARDQWRRAVESVDASRLRVSFTGIERAACVVSVRPALAAVLARLGQPADAWQALEEDFGRGLLDEIAVRADRGLAPAERSRLRELTGELEKLDKSVESTPKELDKAQRAERFDELKRQRDLASIALGEFQTKLVAKYGARAGKVASLNEIQMALAADAALVAWVDVPPMGSNASDPDGEHWGAVLRACGVPTWVSLSGSGSGGRWTRDDDELASRVRTELRGRPGAGTPDVRPLLEKLRALRLDPLTPALSATSGGLPPARRLIVLPSRAIAGIPIEALLAEDEAGHRNESAASAGIPARRAREGEPPPEPSLARRVSMERRKQSAAPTRASDGATTNPSTWTVSYAPSGTVFKYLREQPHSEPHGGLLALGDPIFERPDTSTNPGPPDHGLMLSVVSRGSNAASHGLKEGDVLLAYNGQMLNKKDDLKVVSEGEKPIAVEIWRAGRSSRHELAPGKLGVVVDTRPAAAAIAERRKLERWLVAARSGDEDFAPLPGTRREVEALAQLFKSADRPVRALLGADASEPEVDRIAASGELARFAFIHLATHGVIDEAIPQRSAVILTQTALPDPLEQVMNHKPVFDGRLSVREIQRTWDLKAELVTLSACETALGRESGGEGFVGFTQALLMSGARSVCLSLWKVDDKATSLLMTRFYQNLLGKRAGAAKPMPKAEALQEAKRWLRSLTLDQVDGELAALERGEVRPLVREKGAPARREAPAPNSSPTKPYEHPHFWAAFVLVGDPD